MPHPSRRTPGAPPTAPSAASPGSARPRGGSGPGGTTLRAAANLLQDARLALRSLARRPVFAATAVTSLVLGFGATATVFAVFDATVLRPLPFAAPERLVAIAGTVVRDGVELRAVSYPDFLDWRKARSLEAAAALDLEPLTWTGEAGAERLQGVRDTPDYCSVLGIAAAAGRLLRPEDDAPPQGLAVAVLAEGAARRLFGGTREALGATLPLDGVAFRVVGVLPAGFGGLDGEREVWIPLRSSVRLDPGAAGMFEGRGERGLGVVARLAHSAPDGSPSGGSAEPALERAQEELDAISRALAERYPDTNRDRGARVTPLHQVLLDDAPRTSTALLAAVGLVWLIAWVNVANLLLVRIEERRSEVAVRSALGARPRRLAGQLVVEILVLAALAAPPTLLVASWGTRALASLAPVALPGYVEVALGLRGVAFVLGLVLVTGTLLGIAAARRALRGDLAAGVRGIVATDGPGGAEGGGLLRGRRVLVAAELAVAAVVLVGAGLLVRSFREQVTVDPGFSPRGLVAASLQLPELRYDGEAARTVARRLLEEAEALPGVREAALGSDVMLFSGYRATFIQVPALPEEERQVRAYYHRVSRGFFQAAGIPLLRGRTFSPPSAAVEDDGPWEVVVSRALARRAWPGEDPVGQVIEIGDRPPIRVVGVAGDVRYRTLVPDPLGPPEDPDIYLPLEQSPPGRLALLVRHGPGAAPSAGQLRGVVASLDPALPVFDVLRMGEVVADQTALARFSAFLFSLFAVIAGALAVTGLYGVTAYAVARRRREVGIRIALGARRARVLGLFVGEGLAVALLGVAAGLAGAWAAGRLLEGLLYGVTPGDPATYAAVAAGLTVVALVATLLPARRATRVDPAPVLRAE